MSILAQSGSPSPLLLLVLIAADTSVEVEEVDCIEKTELVPEVENVPEVVGDALLDVVVGPNSPLRYDWTSVGSAVNHDGVLLSRNSDQSNLDTAGTLVRARSNIDFGTPVSKTAPREALNQY